VVIRGGTHRESELPDVPPGRELPTGHARPGRQCISVIGIDRYRRWNRLHNAVSDARGVLATFERLGFESIAQPLLDDAATGEAIRCLPSLLERDLAADDSLVVFFAGHGHTRTTRFSDGVFASKGYLIPVDADDPGGHDHSWQRLDAWLATVAELPPRHILVILDSCHSGIALGRSVQTRGTGVRTDGSAVPFHERRSRRVFTSALDDQRAMDGGPFRGHSVFTGYLIQALRGEPRRGDWRPVVGMNEIAVDVSRRVYEHSAACQVPGLGVLEFDDCGELLISRRRPGAAASPPRVERDRPRRDPAADRAHPRPGDGGLPARAESWELDPALAAALDRHGEERRRGARVLTIVAGDAVPAQASWATWAARHGYLTLATQAVELDAVVADLLAQTPWLRCVPAARQRFAAAAQIDVRAVDASLDARSAADRRTWIDDVAGRDPHARVSGWLLAWLRGPAAGVPDLATAPVRPHELLAIACDLACPTAVLLFCPSPDEPWLARAIAAAAELTAALPGHAVAVTSPDELVRRVLGAQRRGAAWTMARQGLVTVDAVAQRRPGRARHGTLRVLSEALARDPRTRGRFELDGEIRTPDGLPVDAGLLARADRIVVELDTWYHFHDPESYRRDRAQDLRLARAGYFVLRFPAEDVDDRLASTIDQLAIALAGRRAARAVLQETHDAIS